EVIITPIGKFDEGGLITAQKDEHGNINKETESNFTYAVQNIKAGNQLYDAKVEVTRGVKPADYPDDKNDFTDNPDLMADGVYLVNDEDIAQYSNMDAVFAQSYSPVNNPDTLAEKAFETLSKTDSKVDFKDAVRERHIRLVVYKDYQGYVWAKVTYYYIYSYYILDNDGFRISNNNGIGYKRARVNGLENSAFRFSYSLFPGGYEKEKNEPVSVYLMFFPYFKSVTQANPATLTQPSRTTYEYLQDEIEIFKVVTAEEDDESITSNDDSQFYDFDLNLFLYKQKPVEFVDTVLENGETVSEAREMEFNDTNKFTNSYNARISMYVSDSFDLFRTDTLIYTNITQGMLSEYDLEGTVQSVYYGDFDPEEQEVDGTFGFENPDGANYNTRDLVIVDRTVRIYNVKVTIYPGGSVEISDEPYSKIIRGEERTFHDTSGSEFTGEPICDLDASKTP
ncbi:MAG: hypothetical protein IKS39_02960, partial [Clostridia bacterium]|nr:hypothetical protein [Clostridia bacterium]